MLGESHALLNEFPEMEEKIVSLMESNPSLHKEVKDYNALDKQIRVLELNNSPIDDPSMVQLKQHRAQLKDDLYQKLTHE